MIFCILSLTLCIGSSPFLNFLLCLECIRLLGLSCLSEALFGVFNSLFELLFSLFSFVFSTNSSQITDFLSCYIVDFFCILFNRFPALNSCLLYIFNSRLLGSCSLSNFLFSLFDFSLSTLL